MLNRYTRFFIATLALLLIATISFAFDFSTLINKVQERTLDNGLKIIVMERHDAPVVSFVTWADVGSVDDPKEYTGLAHMFEHMAFKGTTTLGSKDIEAELKKIAVEDSLFMELRAERLKGALADSVRVEKLTGEYEAARESSYELVIPNEYTTVVEREGGSGLNAGTATDFTVFFVSYPSNRMELWMAMESERFLNPVFREMYKERDVVAEERRMRVESSPFGRAQEEFLALAFKAHPYGIRGIGHMSDIQNYSRKEANAFFEKYYGPSNLTIAVVGDVKADDVFKMAEKYWGRIKARPAPSRIATVEPEQLGERRMVMEDPAQPLLLIGYHIPGANHPDRYALDALADHLGSGRTSALYKNLVKEKKAALFVAAQTGMPGDKYPTLFFFAGAPTSGHDNDELETEIYAEIEKLKEELITPEELDKIKARQKAEFINQLGDNNGIAFQLAGYEVYHGSWRTMFDELDKYNAVTAEQIREVARKYLTQKNRTVVRVETIGS